MQYMTDAQFLNFAISLVATFFGMLVLILGWLGNKVHSKLESVSSSLHKIEGDLHDRITHIDRRLTAVETRCKYEHDRRGAE